MPIIFFLLIFAVAIVIAVAHSKKIGAAWEEAGSTLGLLVGPGGFFSSPTLVGTLDGQDVRVDTYKRGSGKNSTTYTRITVDYKTPLKPQLNLTSQGVLQGLASFFGSEDHIIGDQEFDDAVVVKGYDADAIRAYLTPARRARILRFLTQFGGEAVTDTGIRWEQRGAVSDAAVIVRQVRLMVDVAQRLSTDDKWNQNLDQALDARAHGNLEEARRLVHVAVESTEVVALEESVMEFQIHRLGDNPSEASKILKRIHEQVPEDSEVAAILASTLAGLPVAPSAATSAAVSTTSGARAPVPSPPAASDVPASDVPASDVPAPDVPAPASASAPAAQAPGSASDAPVASAELSPADPLALATTLFTGSLSTFNAERRFESELLGQRVSWQGTLKHVEAFSYDLIFRDRTGLKVTVDLFQLDALRYGDKTVRAIVEFSIEHQAALEALIGQPIAFEAELTKADCFMHNFYLAHGTSSAS